MAKAKAPPEEAFLLPPGRATALIGWLIAGALLAVAVLMLLPVNRYYQWQQGDGTILFRARWIYERIHFDPTPIDAAAIGSSRLEASVRAPQLSGLLSQRLGRPVRMVNFALPQEGRNLQWAVAKELLENRPEVKLILLSAGEEAVISHPGFRFLGDDASVAGSPVFYNNSYVEDTFTLPYRHFAYFLQGLWPRAFQLSPRFDSAIYRARGFDPTQTHRSGTGNVIDRDFALEGTKADRDRAAMSALNQPDPKLNYLPLDQRYSVERHFVRRIAALAKAKGVTVAFLRVPLYNYAQERFADPGLYHGIGPVLEPTQFGEDSGEYMDVNHLNRRGTARLTPWLADRIEPLVAASEKR